MTLILAILGLGLLVIVHEGGHYLVARWCKMRVERFSIGFGPAILKWQHGDTQFQIAPVPFGGFVQITGMNPHEEFDEADPYVYPNRPVWQRFLTIFAGPATNYLTAVVLIFCVFFFAGVYSDKANIGVRGVVDGSAAKGLLEPGDQIVAVGGTPVLWHIDDERQHNEFKEAVQNSAGAPVTISVERAGKPLEVTITPKAVVQPNGTTEYMVGIELVPEARRVDASLGQAVWASLEYPVLKTRDIAVGLYMVVTRKVDGEFLGPVGITTTIRDQIAGGWVKAFEILAVLNVYLGLFNLLPLPALDGGRLMFLGYELATRRRPNPRFEAAVHMVGFLALFVLMILVTFKDIRKLFAS